MRRMMLFPAVSVALSAPILSLAPLPAQTPAVSASFSQTSTWSSSLSLSSWSSSSRPPPDTWAGLVSTPLPAAPAASALTFASLPNAPALVRPPVDPGFEAIFTVPCSTRSGLSSSPGVDSADGSREPCLQSPNPYARFLDTTAPAPLTPEQKAHLALHNLKDPGNLATIGYTSAFTIATNAHTAYGPGWKGFGSNAGYSLLQDATGEFFGTFLVPSLTHEDPHYHRMPHASFPRRFVHAVSRTLIAQSDNGSPMPNYATLLTNPICAEISNLYVPGINGNGPSTVERIMTGYATDPIDNLVTEFLPDVARRIHIRIIFVQRVLNQVSSDQYTLP